MIDFDFDFGDEFDYYYYYYCCFGVVVVVVVGLDYYEKKKIPIKHEHEEPDVSKLQHNAF